jgi:hypothetical protein
MPGLHPSLWGRTTAELRALQEPQAANEASPDPPREKKSDSVQQPPQTQTQTVLPQAESPYIGTSEGAWRCGWQTLRVEKAIQWQGLST